MAPTIFKQATATRAYGHVDLLDFTSGAVFKVLVWDAQSNGIHKLAEVSTTGDVALKTGFIYQQFLQEFPPPLGLGGAQPLPPP